jgi:hypothetical protein
MVQVQGLGKYLNHNDSLVWGLGKNTKNQTEPNFSNTMPAPIFSSSIDIGSLPPTPNGSCFMSCLPLTPTPIFRHPYWLPPSNTVSGLLTAKHSSPFSSECTSTHVVSYRHFISCCHYNLQPPLAGSPPVSRHPLILAPYLLKHRFRSIDC